MQTSALSVCRSERQSITVLVMIKTKPADLKRFGKRVGELRVAAGLTQEQLADKSGMAYSTLTSIEHGERFTTLGGLKALAKALRVHPIELLRNQ